MNRRLVQRLELQDPLKGRVGSEQVPIYNISLHGVLVRSRVKYPVGHEVQFFAPGAEDEIPLDSRVARCEMVRTDSGEVAYRLALTYPHADLAARARLRQLLVDLFVRAVAEWKRNASVDETSLETFPLFSDRTSITPHLLDGQRAAFIWHRLTRGTWQTSPVPSPSQPVDGFCVTDDIDPEELEMLRSTYGKSDETGRQLVRMLASIAAAERI